jgi:hypothetical protein
MMFFALFRNNVKKVCKVGKNSGSGILVDDGNEDEDDFDWQAGLHIMRNGKKTAVGLELDETDIRIIEEAGEDFDILYN